MTKKRFVAILLCVTLVALAAIGATFAYLTDTKTVNNTFTTRPTSMIRPAIV